MQKVSLQILPVGYLRKALICNRGVHLTRDIIGRRLSYTAVLRSNDLSKNIVKSIPILIMDFVKKESNYIKESLVREDWTEKEYPETMNIPKNVQDSLDESVDDYNKFLTLLSFNPSDIPPSVYLHYLYDKSIEIDEKMKQLLVSRLSFHQLFDHIWKTLVDEGSTINDLETIVESIGRVMEENNNLHAGILGAVLSSQTYISNQSFHSVIIDCFSHNFPISKDNLVDAVSYNLKLHKLPGEIEVNNPFTSLLNAKNIVENATPMEPITKVFDNFQILRSCGELPGWFDFIMKDTAIQRFTAEELLCIFGSVSGIKLNDYDFQRLIQSEVLSVSQIFQLYFKEIEKVSNIKSRPLSYLVNAALRDSKMDEVLFLCVKQFKENLNSKDLGEILVKLYNDSNDLFGQCLNLLNDGNYTKSIQYFLERYIPNGANLVLIHRALLSTCELPQFEVNLRQFIPIKLAEVQDISDLYLNFIKSQKRRTKHLLEILRNFLIRNGVVDVRCLDAIFLSTVLKTTFINEEGQVTIDPRYKKKFHNTIRELSQVISDMKNKNDTLKAIVTIIQSMHNQIVFPNNPEFSKYLQRKMILQILGFILKAKGPEYMQDILKDLSLPADLYQYVSTLYQVKDNPKLAFEVVSKNVATKSKLNKNLVNALDRGILTSETLSIKEKLSTFKEFRRHLKISGFKSRVSTENFIILVETLLRDETIMTKEKLMDKLVSVSYSKKVPKRLLLRWISKS